MPSNSPREVGDFLIPDLPLPLLRHVTVIRPESTIFRRSCDRSSLCYKYTNSLNTSLT